MTTRADRGRCKANPMPERRKQLPFTKLLTASEAERVLLGLLPDSMDDKWCIFVEEDVIHCCRSWTGNTIYLAKLISSDRGFSIEELWVNREPTQNKHEDDDHEIALFTFLIDYLMLGKQVPFPFPPGLAKEKKAVLRHNVVGSTPPGGMK